MDEVRLPAVRGEVGLQAQRIRVRRYRNPFTMAYDVLTVPSGGSVAEILEISQPRRFRDCELVTLLDGILLPPEWRHHTRPKPYTVVDVRSVPRGGSMLRTLLMVAVAVAAVVGSVVTFGALAPVIGTAFAMAVGGLAASAISPGGTMLQHPTVRRMLP